MTATTWNAFNKSGGMAIGATTAGDGMSAVTIAGGYTGIRSVGNKSTGKFHIEYYINNYSGSDFAVGFGNASHTLTNWLGIGQGMGFYADNRVYAGGGQIGTAIAYTSGSIVQAELDAGAGTVQFRVGSGGTWFGPYTLPGSGPWFAMFTCQNAGGEVTVNAGDTAFSGSLSSGYSAWNASGEVWNHSDKATNMMVLTSSPLSVIAVAGTNPGVFATRKPATGNVYWEIAAPALTSGFSIGIADQAWNPSNNSLLGSDNLGLGYRQDGTVKLNNVTLQTIMTYTQADTIQVAVRTLDRTIFFKKNNAGDWNNTAGANPATNTGGISYATMAFSSIAPAVSAAVVSPFQVAVAAFSTAGWAYSAPSGFGSTDDIAVLGISRFGKPANNNQINDVNVSARILGKNYGQYSNDPKTAVHVYNGTSQTAVSGATLEATVPVSGKIVRLYDQATGKFLGEYKSDPTTGHYHIPGLGRAKVYVVGLDAGFTAQALDNLTPV